MPDNISLKSLLGPLVALNLWTFIMEAWMYYLRIPALTKYNVPTDPSISAETFKQKLPRYIQWPAENYNHLMEQPTQFYAVCLALAFLRVNDSTTVGIAWAYVGLRVVHSLVHATVNKIMVRFSLFIMSSVVLLGLTLRAAMEVF